MIFICFTGMMRISEVLSLTMADVLLPADHAMGDYVLILLRSGKRDVPDATRIVIGLPPVVRWLTVYKLRLCAGRAQTSPFCQVSYSTFRKWLRRAAPALGFEEGFYTSHSMRRGGATEMTRAGVPLLDAMHYGRWTSFSSFRLYIAKGDVLLTRLKQQLSDAEWRKLEVLSGLTMAVIERAVACADV